MGVSLPTTSPLPPVDPLLGREVGGYFVEALLGEGGMGLVYRARHPILNRAFAIKVLRPEVAEDKALATHFIREAQTLSGLKHPNIIDIVGFGELDGNRQYMVMEFVEGRTLEAELTEHGRLVPERALALADQVLDGLVAAHAVEVVHRDLKPSNVFLARVSGGAELVKLLDFGLARLQPEVMQAGVGVAQFASVAAGTPEYVAPEQARGLAANKQSDVYSFGVMLFEMLTGGRPFQPAAREEDPVGALLRMHARTPAPSLSSGGLPFSFPEELEALVGDLLKKDPAERPSAQTVRSRLTQLRRALQAQSTQVRRNPLPPEEEPLVVPRRSMGKWLAGLSVLVAVLLALVLWPSANDLPRPPGGEGRGEGPAPATPRELDTLTPLGPRPAAPPAPPPPPPPVPAPRPVVAAPVVVKKRYEISRSTCEPNERWRSSARTHLQELQQAAANSSDPKAFARFERAEPGLTSSIASASTGDACEAVDRAIESLARTLTP